MDTIEKLMILSSDSQYDLACACGTGKDDRRRRGLDGRWLYPVTLPQGGYAILLKTLLSNACRNDCGYCPLRSGSNIRRCSLAPEEVANIFMEYLRKKKVFGLFLSSGVMGGPDYTMERINSVARILRRTHEFRGYIHLKIIPGASDAAIEESLSLASAVSLNIETPGRERFEKLSERKGYDRDIIRPLKLISQLTETGGRYSRIKCTTQFIVGASDEKDSEIINYTFGLYDKLKFERVYFSAYQRGLGIPNIPGELTPQADKKETFVREHRLYQADFLIRKYGFAKEDFILDTSGNLSLERDPKEVWAAHHPEFYPVRLNSADREAILRVPGIGPETVKRILKQRRERRITSIDDIGIRGKRLETIRRYAICE